MIDFIRGDIASLTETGAVIDTGGIGYSFLCSSMSLSELSGKKEDVLVYIYMSVGEAGINLYGFTSKAEREIFLRLITVSKVGAKVALNILSLYTPQEVAMLIASSDIKALTRATGVGKKLAEAIIFHLKDKFSAVQLQEVVSSVEDFSVEDTVDIKNEAVMALVSLGFDRAYSVKIVKKVYTDGITEEELISRALMRVNEER